MGDTGGRDAGGAASGEGTTNFDSYIGSLISLTSKSDIRYEGILYTIDAENCNIALQNVRSYGTEGRKKEGPQIPPKDSVYDYIIFRGSDIKDLQVKSSPHAYTDPAIIAQSQQQKQRVPTSVMPSPLGIPAPAGMPQVPGYSHSPVIPHPPVQPRDSQGLLPPGFVNSSYPPVGLGAWGPRPPPVGNGPMPMYWPGFYPPTGQPPFMQSQQQPLLPPERPGSGAQTLHPPPVSDGIDKMQPSIGMTAVLTPIATRLPRVSQAPLEPPPVEVKKEVAEQQPVEAPVEVVKVPNSPKPESAETSSDRQARAKPDVKVENARHDYVRGDNGRHNWRGNGRRGGRGRGFYYRSTQNFTEDFDFTAMNERFNKDEVWGELGKAGSPEDDEVSDKTWQKSDDAGKKPVYVKDEFFDSLSCDALDREGGHSDRPRFSEQRKINTETFGDAFLRSRRGNYRGGYHSGRGGSYRRGGGRSHQAASV